MRLKTIEKDLTLAARTAAVVFPEPPLPKKVTSLVESGGESPELALTEARIVLNLGFLARIWGLGLGF